MTSYKGKMIAAMLAGGKCPVGLVVNETSKEIEIRLLSFVTSRLMDDYKIIRKADLCGVFCQPPMTRQEQKEFGYREYQSETYDFTPLWQTQIDWIEQHEDKDAQ